MTERGLFVLLSCFIASLYCELTETEVKDFTQGLNNLENKSIHWNYPTDSSSYLDGHGHCTDSSKDIDDGQYDFIIVGGGTSGIALANRLSENSKWKILVLEAGELENKFSEVPAEVNYLIGSELNWGYNSVSLKNFGGYINRSVIFPCGKALGGSSVTNYMLYARGNPEDYNDWAAMGNPGWAFKDVLPYFRKSEHAAFPNADPNYHGEDGPVNVEYVPYRNELARAFLDAQVEMGRKRGDYNSEDQLVFNFAEVTEINGTRDSASRAFWKPVRHRSNLNISFNTLVLKILINETSKNAYGVRYLRNGTCYYARAKKEVIVSAGALNTPQILMLSGIGPKWHLEEKGIKVIQDLCVGENLWDHLAYSAQAYSVNYTYPDQSEEDTVREYLQAQGSLTTPAGMQAFGFVNLANDNSGKPDMEYVFSSGPPKPQPYLYHKTINRYTEETYVNVVKPQENITNYVVFSVVLYSKTRGTIRLKSPSPLDFPLIRLDYFNNEYDVNTMLRGLRDLQKAANTSALRKFDSKLIEVSLPECKSFKYDSDDFWICMIKNLAQILHHYGGTCKMGPKCDDKAVVDPYLQVYGIQNLRVVDCSVIPTAISAHTMQVAYMIAEKAADMLKQKYIVN